MDKINTLHSLRRTSPKGGPFAGVCTQCGTVVVQIGGGDSAKLDLEGCPNPLGMTVGESILEAIEPNAIR